VKDIAVFLGLKMFLSDNSISFRAVEMRKLLAAQSQLKKISFQNYKY